MAKKQFPNLYSVTIAYAKRNFDRLKWPNGVPRTRTVSAYSSKHAIAIACGIVRSLTDWGKDVYLDVPDDPIYKGKTHTPDRPDWTERAYT